MISTPLPGVDSESSSRLRSQRGRKCRLVIFAGCFGVELFLEEGGEARLKRVVYLVDGRTNLHYEANVCHLNKQQE